MHALVERSTLWRILLRNFFSPRLFATSPSSPPVEGREKPGDFPPYSKVALPSPFLLLPLPLPLPLFEGSGQVSPDSSHGRRKEEEEEEEAVVAESGSEERERKAKREERWSSSLAVGRRITGALVPPPPPPVCVCVCVCLLEKESGGGGGVCGMGGREKEAPERVRDFGRWRDASSWAVRLFFFFFSDLVKTWSKERRTFGKRGGGGGTSFTAC